MAPQATSPLAMGSGSMGYNHTRSGSDPLVSNLSCHIPMNIPTTNTRPPLSSSGPALVRHSTRPALTIDTRDDENLALSSTSESSPSSPYSLTSSPSHEEELSRARSVHSPRDECELFVDTHADTDTTSAQVGWYPFQFLSHLLCNFDPDALCVCGPSAPISVESNKSLGERLSSAYTHGIFNFLPPDPKRHRRRRASSISSHTNINQFQGKFISPQEKEYALRWRGHLPLGAMYDTSTAAVEGRRKRVEYLRRRRGAWPHTRTEVSVDMSNVNVHAVKDVDVTKKGRGLMLKTVTSGVSLSGDSSNSSMNDLFMTLTRSDDTATTDVE